MGWVPPVVLGHYCSTAPSRAAHARGTVTVTWLARMVQALYILSSNKVQEVQLRHLLERNKMSEVCICTSVHVREKAASVNAVNYGCKNTHKIYFVEIVSVINALCLVPGTVFVQKSSQLW